ncbi:MAG: DUF2793 domain-containing protein [Hyphomicrobiales bacterium]
MSDTPNLGLPYIEAAQAQKHVTHNEALRVIDALAQLAVLGRDLSEPPASPGEGDRYLVAAAASGAWSGYEDHVAAWQDGAWMFHAPRVGWLCWVADQMSLVTWDGESWTDAAAAMGAMGDLETLGVNATADETNRLAVSSAATLLTHEGAGHQLKVNKNAPGDTASLLFQSAFSGRAEMGLAGDDDFHFKVSADGEEWNEAIVIDRATGEVSLPNTEISGGSGGGGGGNAGLGASLFWAAN